MSTPPPMPPEPSRSEQMADIFSDREKAGKPQPPKRKGMHGCLIALIIAAVLAIPAIAILAAIAIPQYQDYVTRSKVMMGAIQAEALQSGIDQYAEANGSCPDNAALGLESDTINLGVATSNGQPQAVVTVGGGQSGGCAIELRFAGIGPAVDGKTLVYESNQGNWSCSGGTLADRLKPRTCKY